MVRQVNRYGIRSFLKRNDTVTGQEYGKREQAYDLVMEKLEPVFKAVERGDWTLAKANSFDDELFPVSPFYVMTISAGINDADRIYAYSLSGPVRKPYWASDEAWNKFCPAAIDRDAVTSAFLCSLGSRRFLDVFRHRFHLETGMDHRKEMVRKTSQLINEELGSCKIGGQHDRITQIAWPVIQTMVWTSLMATMIGNNAALERVVSLSSLLTYGIPISTMHGEPHTWLMLVG